MGALSPLWMFARAIRRMGKAAKKDTSSRGAFLVATTASVASFAVGMFTYDALSFIQVTFVLFIVLAARDVRAPDAAGRVAESRGQATSLRFTYAAAPARPERAEPAAARRARLRLPSRESGA